MRLRSGMLAVLVVLATLAGLGSTSVGATGSPCAAWMNRHDPPQARASALERAMTLQDKVDLVTGDTGQPTPDYPNYGAAGVVFANPRLCIPALVLNDAAAGIGDSQVGTTAFPDGVTQASTWDVPLLRHYGRILGHEAFIKGVNVLLGPGLDILRDPLNGRGWEYYGEDPFLTGHAAAAIIRGIEQNPVVATAKHYAADDEEGTPDNNYGAISNNVGQRTMEEIELPAFRDAIQAGVGSIMCTSEQLNDVYACQNRRYLTNVLRGQLHFSGWVMSDWQAARSTVGSADGGMDMEMPSAQYYGPALKRAVQQGRVGVATLDRMVHRILFTMFRQRLFDRVPQEREQAFAANASTATSIRMAKQIAQEGTVLLKDSRHVLPISGAGRRIAVIGSPASPQGATLAEQGYGSAHVPEPGYPPDVVSPLQAITTRATRAGDVVTYSDGGSTQAAVAAARAADVAVVFVSDVSTEGFDRPNMNPRAGTCDLVTQNGCTYSSVNQNALVSAVARSNPNTIVVLQNGGPLSMPWLARVRGVLENWYPGQVDGDSIAPLLFGDSDPSGHLPETIPRRLSEGPLRTRSQYPGVKGQVDHSEGLLVGYRWYQARHLRPLFPFGFGLSYTSFRFSGLRVRSRGGRVLVSFSVANTGRRAGADVAQVYVGDPRAAGEPPEQLKGFDRVSLRPGQTRRVTVALAPVSFAHWSTRAGTWTVSPGRYTIGVGDSSAALPLTSSVQRPQLRLAPSAA